MRIIFSYQEEESWNPTDLYLSISLIIDRLYDFQKQPLEIFFKNDVLKKIHLCWILFPNKVAGLRPATLLKKRLRQRCVSVNFTKFLRAPFFTEHLRTTASESLIFIWFLSNFIESDMQKSASNKEYERRLEFLGHVL